MVGLENYPGKRPLLWGRIYQVSAKVDFRCVPIMGNRFFAKDREFSGGESLLQGRRTSEVIVKGFAEI